MHPILNKVTLRGIIEPNHVYLMAKSISGELGSQHVHNLYTIESDEELLEGINTDLEKVLCNEFTPLKFLSVQQLTDQCYQVTIRVSSKKTGYESLYHWYVHQVPSSRERNAY